MRDNIIHPPPYLFIFQIENLTGQAPHTALIGCAKLVWHGGTKESHPHFFALQIFPFDNWSVFIIAQSDD